MAGQIGHPTGRRHSAERLLSSAPLEQPLLESARFDRSSDLALALVYSAAVGRAERAIAARSDDCSGRMLRGDVVLGAVRYP